MATLSEKTLGQAQVTTGTDTLYTVPASTTGIVKYVLCVNTTGTAATITVWADADGTTASDATVIIPTVSVPANEFIALKQVWIPMIAASTIKATAGTGSAITVTIGGVEIS